MSTKIEVSRETKVEGKSEKQEPREASSIKQETVQTEKKGRAKKSFFQKIKYTFQNICAKIKTLFEKKEKLTTFISDEIHRSAFCRIWKEVIRLARFLKPKKVRMYMKFGFRDPCNTGQVLALLSMLYPAYGAHMQLQPDFEEEVLEGDLLIKGHIHGIYAGVIVWNLLFDQNVRTAYKHMRAFEF